MLKKSQIDTPLGLMEVIADEQLIYLLEFVDLPKLHKEVQRIRKNIKSEITEGRTKPMFQIEVELSQYFKSELEVFQTPLFINGTNFQNRVWEELKKIPLGKTNSYLEIATAIGKQTAFRAVALANGANQFAIVIPCHRVINHNGELGGYSGGLDRKKWLLKHENIKFLNRG